MVESRTVRRLVDSLEEARQSLDSDQPGLESGGLPDPFLTPSLASVSRPTCETGAAAFELTSALGSGYNTTFRGQLTRPTRSRAYASTSPLPGSLQGSLPACRARLWPGGFAPAGRRTRFQEIRSLLPSRPALPGRISPVGLHGAEFACDPSSSTTTPRALWRNAYCIRSWASIENRSSAGVNVTACLIVSAEVPYAPQLLEKCSRPDRMRCGWVVAEPGCRRGAGRGPARILLDHAVRRCRLPE